MNTKALVIIIGIVLVFAVPIFWLNSKANKLEDEKNILLEETEVLQNELKNKEAINSNQTDKQETNKQEEASNDSSTNEDALAAMKEELDNVTQQLVESMFNRNTESVETLNQITSDQANTWLNQKGYLKPFDDENGVVPQAEVLEIKNYIEVKSSNELEVVTVYVTDFPEQTLSSKTYGIIKHTVNYSNDNLRITEITDALPLADPEIKLYFGQDAN